MPQPPDTGLRAALANADAALSSRESRVRFAALAAGNPLSVDPMALMGAAVLIRTQSQLAAALALVALDGVAARLVIAPPDLPADYLADVIERAGIDTLVTDGAAADALTPKGLMPKDLVPVTISTVLTPRGTPPQEQPPARASEWVMFTSGTTGAPKMVTHTLAALTGAQKDSGKGAGGKVVWATFYDIRRYGGLQILLRALTGGRSLILSDPAEAVGAYLARLEAEGVTHLTGTPSHWRRALMSPAIKRLAPRYVRLSGEIADQAVLDALTAQFPGAAIVHAYASTEAGVGFEVADGLEGFPADFIGRDGPVEMRVVAGALQIRSPRTANGYLGHDQALKQDGFVDTGDMVEQRGARFYFTGRRGGIINVGGLKINPEEVEAVINRHPGVAASRVSGRKSPITGAIVVADILLADAANDNATFREALLSLCREHLPAFKVPALVRFVPTLELTAGGKLSRHG